MMTLKDKVEEALATPDALCAYLKTAPQRAHICGNTFRCVVANFISDEFLPPNSVIAVAEGEINIFPESKIVPVQGVEGTKDFDRVVHLNGKSWLAGETDYSSFIPPEWVDELITEFDKLGPGDTEVLSNEVITRGLIPNCSVEVKDGTTAGGDISAQVEST